MRWLGLETRDTSKWAETLQVQKERKSEEQTWSDSKHKQTPNDKNSQREGGGRSHLCLSQLVWHREDFNLGPMTKTHLCSTLTINHG